MTPRPHSEIYIAACSSEERGGIWHCRLDGDELRTVGHYPLDRPMYLAIDGDKLYVLIRQPDEDSKLSGLASYDIAPDGSLHNMSKIVSTKGIVACHLDVIGGVPYVVNYLSGNVVRMGGEGHTADIVKAHSGSSVHPTRQTEPHTHFVHEAPNGELLTVDLGIDTIVRYDRALNELGRIRVPAGEGCRHLAFSPDGQYIYCANELGSSVSVIKNNEVIATVPALPTDFTGESTAAAIRVSADGKYLYISHRGHDSVTAFDLTDGIPTDPVWVNCGGESPRDFLIVGDRMIVTNEKTDNVTCYRVNGKIMSKLPCSLDLPNPLCVIAKVSI